MFVSIDTDENNIYFGDNNQTSFLKGGGGGSQLLSKHLDKTTKTSAHPLAK